MKQDSLDKANELDRVLRKAKSDYEDMVLWRGEHMNNNEKDLSLSNVGHGWISIPSESKQDIIFHVETIVTDNYKLAQKNFDEYKPLK